MAKQNTTTTTTTTNNNNNNNSWVRGKCIGKGSFGTVSVAVNKSNGTVFAVKSVPCNNSNPQVWLLENEIRILRSLSSPCIVNFLGDDVSHESLTSYRNLHLEYMPNGTVADADVDEKIVRPYTWCIVSALKYIHDRGIVHCDVKGKNVLVGPNNSSFCCKLADFGSAIELDRCAATITPRGSPLWMAPEVIRGESQGPESDVWSLGCTIIEMVTGKPAWEDKGLDTLSRIGFSNELPEFPTRLSQLGRDFLEKCLRREPSKRWSCDQLLQHPFLLSVSPVVSVTESSPRCVLDWVNSEFDQDDDGDDDEVATGCEVSSARERIGKLVTKTGAIWESDGWVAVRSDEEGAKARASENCGESTKMEYPDLTRTEEETAGTCSVYSNSMWIRMEFCNSDDVYGPTSGLQGGASSSCQYGSQKVEYLAVEMGFYSLYNLLLLCCFTIFRYILLVFFVIYYYILCLVFLSLICACDCYYYLCFGFRHEMTPNFTGCRFTAKMQEYNAFFVHHFVLYFEENISNSTIFRIRSK